MQLQSVKLEALEERQYLERLLVIYQSFQDYIQALIPLVKGECPPSSEFAIIHERLRLKFKEYENLFLEWNEGDQTVYTPIALLLFKPEKFYNNERGFELALPLATTKFQDIIEKRMRSLREAHERITLLESEAKAEEITHIPKKSLMATIKEADQLAEIASKWGGQVIRFAPWALELLNNLHH